MSLLQMVLNLDSLVFYVHVDDMLGGGDSNSAAYVEAEAQLQKAFNLRTWQKDESFEYCGASMTRDPGDTWHVSHDGYIRKIQPIPVERVGNPTNR